MAARSFIDAVPFTATGTVAFPIANALLPQRGAKYQNWRPNHIVSMIGYSRTAPGPLLRKKEGVPAISIPRERTQAARVRRCSHRRAARHATPVRR